MARLGLLYTDELRRIELKKQESKIYLWIKCDLIRLYETKIFYLFVWFDLNSSSDESASDLDGLNSSDASK